MESLIDRVRSKSRLRSQTRAREVVNEDVPGDLEVYLSRLGGSDPILIVRAGGKELETSLNTSDTIYVEPDQDIEFEVVVENRDGVDGTNPDSCSNPDEPDGSGSLIGDAGVDLRVVTGGFANNRSVCADIDSFGKTQYKVTLPGRVPDVDNGRVVFNSFHVEGGGSGIRLTPEYSVKFNVTDKVDGVAAEVPDDGGGDDGGDTGGGGDWSFDKSTLDISCSSEVQDPATLLVDVNVDGFLSLDAPEGCRRLEIDLYLDGKRIAREEGNVSVNGASGAEFEVQNLKAGNYQIGYEVNDAGWC